MRAYLFYVIGCLTLTWTVLVNADDALGPNVTPPHDGQPGCGIRYEFRRLWRNNFNPETYWECATWRVPATQRRCPLSTRFQDAWQTCVPFNQWQWTPYSEPPTRPGCGHVEECDEIVIVPEPEPECPWVCPGDNSTTITTPGWTESTVNYNTTEGWLNSTESVTTPDGSGTNSTTPIFTVTTTLSTTTDGGGNGGGPDIDPMGICPGASDSQHDPGTMSCFPPECTFEQWLKGTLYPTRDPTAFFQCGAGVNNLHVMPCGPGTCFSYRQQVCIHARDWQNDCA